MLNRLPGKLLVGATLGAAGVGLALYGTLRDASKWVWGC